MVKRSFENNVFKAYKMVSRSALISMYFTMYKNTLNCSP